MISSGSMDPNTQAARSAAIAGSRLAQQGCSEYHKMVHKLLVCINSIRDFDFVVILMHRSGFSPRWLSYLKQYVNSFEKTLFIILERNSIPCIVYCSYSTTTG